MTTKNMNTPPGSTQENEIDLLRLVGELWDHRKFIISVTALFTLIAVAYSLLSTPIYQADTLVQVEQKQGNAILSGLSDMIPNSSPESAPEIQLLQSRMILGKTIAELNLRDMVEQKYFPIVGRGWARLTKEKPGELAISWMHIPQLNGQDQQLTLTVGENGHYTLEGEEFTVNGMVGQRLEKDGVALTIADIKAKPGTQFVLSQRTELEAINALQETFTVSERSKESGMLELTMTGDDPQLITRILNSIANNYLQQNIARQAAQDSQSLEFLQRQLPEVRSELDQAEEKLNVYRQQRDSVDLNLEAKAVLEQIVNVDNQLNELTFREAEISQLYKKDHPTYRALLEKRQTLEQERKRLNKRVSAMPSTQQEVLRLSRDVEAGRAVYLAGKDELNKVIQHFGKGGFDVITRGQVPPNPSELLMRDRMRQLLEWANDHYDLVIVDTPPMLAVSDAAVVGRSVGTSLLVARFGLNTAKEVSLSMQRLEQAGVNIKGAILNGVIKRASTAYSYGYNYYGYSYSEKE
ncbi:Wzz/FepE/Etk N-terminal domain-containing protein [Escherichia coli]|nr:protein-tyrosine kinase [Escherichia coli]